jgi:predicted metal-dependent phosphoesterase TrpH
LRVRGAVHVHSTLSHDGTMTISEVARFYRDRDFQFVAMGEHSQDMDEARAETLRAECEANSDANFRMVPGIEFTCDNGVHILGVGVTQLSAQCSPVEIGRHIRERQGYSVLAHPTRFGWKCAPEILRAVDAAEIWNVGYDGKYVPSVNAARNFAAMRTVNPDLHAIASHDLHHSEAFYNVAVEMDIHELRADAVITRLRTGQYRNVSTLFRNGPRATMSGSAAAWLRLVGWPRDRYRQVRRTMLGWSR